MNKPDKPKPLEIFRTMWPVLLFILGLSVWALQKQTVSNADFVELEIRVVVLEEHMPKKDMMQEIFIRLASMETQITQLSKAMIRIENMMFKKDSNQ